MINAVKRKVHQNNNNEVKELDYSLHPQKIGSHVSCTL